MLAALGSYEMRMGDGRVYPLGGCRTLSLMSGCFLRLWAARRRRRAGVVWGLGLAVLLLAGPAAVGLRAQSGDGQSDAAKAADAAGYLLDDAVTVQRDGRHNRLLGALRHMRDPALRPLFDRLAAAEHPALRIHGLLGQAELRRPEPRLSPDRLAEVEHPAVQVQLISAALDNDLLPLADARKLLDWDDLDIGVKLLIALRLVGQATQADGGAFAHKALLRDGLNANRLARRGLAALLLHQLGEPAGAEGLQKLNRSDDPQRDAARLMLLRAAMRHKLHRVASWAYAVTTEPEISAKLRGRALRAALRFGDPRAVDLWQQRFESASGAAQRNQLAITALRVAPWCDPALFEWLRNAAQTKLLRQVARCGVSIAAGRGDVPDRVVQLVRMNHPLVRKWALTFAREHAKPSHAQLILLGIVMAYDEGPQRTRVRRLDAAMQAAQQLHKQDAQAAANMLRPILKDADTDTRLTTGILLGLVRTRDGEPQQVLRGVGEFTEPRNQHLALLLRAKHGGTLSDRQMWQLALLVRGGGQLQDSLRIQAAWTWLKHAGRADAVVRRVIDRM